MVPTRVAICNARIFAGDEGAIVDGMLLLQGERIIAVGAAPPPPDARVIDAAGGAVVPGLVDLHVHFGARAAESVGRAADALQADYAAQRPGVRAALLASGITTIRSVGDLLHVILDLKRQTGQGSLLGPRVHCAGPTFTAPGGHPAGTLYRGSPFLIRHGTREVVDAGEARARVAELASAGVDGVKVIYGGAGLPRLSRRLLEAIADAARAQGLWLAVHTTSCEEVRDAAAVGAQSVEHGVTRDEAIDDDSVRRLRDGGVTYVPTLTVALAHLRARRPDAVARLRDNLRAVRDAGVPIGAGSDTQGPTMAFGRSLIDELEALVAAGLTAREALMAATRVAARTLGVGAERGTIAEGKQADLLIVDGNPWEAISDLRRVRGVVLGGRQQVVAPRPR